MIMSRKKKIDWEKRRYEMASALFFQDIRNTDIQCFPFSRVGEWSRLAQCAASDAVVATDIFMREFRKTQQNNNPSKDG